MSASVPYSLETRVKIRRTATDVDRPARSLGTNNPLETDYIVKAVECQECTLVALPPIRTCTTGHLICSFCLPRVKKCKVCANAFTDVPNITAEGLVAILELKCRYQGCRQSFRAQELAKHLPDCQYRPVICHERRSQVCNGNGIDFFTFVNHLEVVHGCPAQDLSGETLKKCAYHVRDFAQDRTWPFLVLAYEGKHFLVRLKLRSSNALCLIACLASEGESSKYSARILTQHPLSIPRMELILPVHSIHMVEEEFEAAGHVGCIPEHTLLSVSKRIHGNTDDGGEYNWNIFIKIEKIRD